MMAWPVGDCAVVVVVEAVVAVEVAVVGDGRIVEMVVALLVELSDAACASEIEHNAARQNMAMVATRH